MNKKNIINTLILFSVLVVFFLPLLSIAAPERLEIEYPPIPGVPPLTRTVTLPVYVKYIYYLFLAISGIIALGVIVVAGFRYLSSVGMPEKLKDAKNQIASAILGLLLLACSWLILRTINPQLVVLRLPDDLPPTLPDLNAGVYLCREGVDIMGFWSKRRAAESQTPAEQRNTVAELVAIQKTIDQHCSIQEREGDIGRDFEDKIKWVYLVPDFRKQQYGVILYEESGFKGAGTAIYGNGEGGVIRALEAPTGWGLEQEFPGFLASSARPFIINYHPNPSWFVKLYEAVHHNRGTPGAESKCWSVGPVPGCGDMNIDGQTGYINTANIFTSPQNSENGMSEIGSIQIEGDLVVIFFKEPGGEWYLDTEINIFPEMGFSSDDNLNNNLMGVWIPECVKRREPHWQDESYPCANNMVIISADFLN